MATATIKKETIKKVELVEKVIEVETGKLSATLELNHDEILALTAVLRNIGGSDATCRRYIQEIHNALGCESISDRDDYADVRRSLSGEMYFRDKNGNI